MRVSKLSFVPPMSQQITLRKWSAWCSLTKPKRYAARQYQLLSVADLSGSH
jgi:hypothetical protein